MSKTSGGADARQHFLRKIPAMTHAAATSIDRPHAYGAVARAWRQLHNALLDTYRPELHYMRGPGPKCREKHAAPQADHSRAIATRLVRAIV